MSPEVRSRPGLPEGRLMVVGLARSGVAAANALRDRGREVVAVDSGNPTAAAGLAGPGVEVHLDAEGTDLLGGVTMLVKSPGVPRQAPVVAAAVDEGIPVIGELELGWRLLGNRFIGVTGTNGKTTVVEWLGHVFAVAGEPARVVGNVGTPVSSLADGVDPGTTLICEVSSFQLEDSLEFAPEVAVFLNLTPDHLDRHGQLDDYLAAKLKIFANQGPGDVAVFDADELERLGATLPGTAEPAGYGGPACAPGVCSVRLEDGDLYDGDGLLCSGAELALPGEHNLRNAAAVATAALAAGIGREALIEALRSFGGVAHRLELVAEREGVRYVNDSKATNVAAAVAALESFSTGVRVILGGSLKGAEFDQLAPAVERHCRAAYLIGEAADPLRRALTGTGVELFDCGDLETAVGRAAADASAGETVLLAPACASFDAFRDYEQRGDRFRELVGELR